MVPGHDSLRHKRIRGLPRRARTSGAIETGRCSGAGEFSGFVNFRRAEYAPALAHIERSIGRECAVPAGDGEGAAVSRGDAAHPHRGLSTARSRSSRGFCAAPRQPGVLLTALGPGGAPHAAACPRTIPAGAAGAVCHRRDGRVLADGGRSSRARAGIQTLLARYPTAHHVHYLYACSLLAADPEPRDRGVSPGTGDHSLERGALAMLAWALLNRGDSAAALPYAERAAKSDPSGWTPPCRTTASAWS